MKAQKDDIVYSLMGQQGTYISPFQSGHLVAPHCEDHEGELVLAEPENWKQIFLKPPTAVLEKEVDRLSTQIKEMAGRVTDLRTQEQEARRGFDATCKKLKTYEPLKNVVDFLDGKMTHMLVVSCYNKTSIKVLAIEDTQADERNDDYRNGKWCKPLKLLALNGHSRRPERLEWRLYGYSDGSGSSELAYPFTSEQDAKNKAKEMLTPFLENWASPENINGLSSIIASALAVGMEIPPEALARLKQMRIDNRKKEVERAEAELKRQHALLAKESE